MTVKNDDTGEILIENVMLSIKKLKGVLHVQRLSHEDRKSLMEMESSRNGDVIPVINKGLQECLNREFCLILIKDENFRTAPTPTVLLVTDKGRILGQELLSPREKEIYHDRGDVYFLSDDFVLFKPDKILERTLNEKEFFLLPPVPFPELEEFDEISEVTSCSPSTRGDSYLKEKYGYPQDPHIATIIVGFSLKK
jgi:hypothetical protein